MALIILAAALSVILGVAAYHQWLQAADDQHYERERARRRHPSDSTPPPSRPRCRKHWSYKS